MQTTCTSNVVIPAQAGIQSYLLKVYRGALDSRLRGKDGVALLQMLMQSIIVLASIFVFAASAGAQEKDANIHPRVPGPQFTLPESTEKCVHDPDFAKTGKCVRDTAFMRRNHPDLLTHKRDVTVYDGIRTKSASLQNCINCHVTKDQAGKAIKVSDPKHFCAACHEYVAVKLDCFECHRSTPDTPASSANIPRIPRIPGHANLLARNSNGVKALGRFLKGLAQ